ncbi:MAG: 50S ribosome-binding GTPase [Candidatus Zixiibacteriota bacterium]|nr:MAG: 50S ribosome-binding GTPase [candidate division Zixibacteria bacterium]
MPANLPPQYYELERTFKAEKDPREKLRLAQELLSIMPKHKGTDKLQADLKAKISKLKKQISGAERSHGTVQAAAHDHIPKEGAGQIILIGPPNSGKSSLVDVLTGAKPTIADYPYTTREPLAGMMVFETVQLQLIDTPPISEELYENYLSGLIRSADLVALVCDLADERMLDNLEILIKRLEDKRILLAPEVRETPDDPRYCLKKTVMIAHKALEDESGEKRAVLSERFRDFKIMATSIIDDDSLAILKRGIFDALEIIRVYTKQIGKEVDLVDPIILPVGGTVQQAANEIHKDFGWKLKFAKLWGKGKYDGQRVQRDYVLQDEDIIEFHI